MLGGFAGLSGPIPILWASVRGWAKDERRGLFQTFNWTILSAALCVQAAAGMITRQVMWLALLVLPATIGGAWLGARTYRGLSDGNFRDVVLGLLFLSGVALVWTSVGMTGRASDTRFCTSTWAISESKPSLKVTVSV